jgi:putative transposase
LAILSSSSTVARGSLEGLSREVAREGVRGVVFLDHAPFHRSRGFREAVERWRGRGLEVAYLPRYSPHLNPVETIWRRVKGFLMPRRHYGGRVKMYV